MSTEITDRAIEVITPVVEALGYEVVEITYTKSYGEYNLTVYIFKKGGVTLDDCVAVNDALDPVLEANDITNGGNYNLNISSPGLDRPIVSLDDYRRSLDTEIEILFKVPMGKKKKVNGILLSYDDESVVLKVRDKDTVLRKDNFEVVRPYIKF